METAAIKIITAYPQKADTASGLFGMIMTPKVVNKSGKTVRKKVFLLHGTIMV